MSRYMLIHRLRAPAVLLLIGILALLHQSGVIPDFWRLFWPLLFILLGVLLLAERAALAAEGYPIFPCGPGQSAGQAPNQTMNQGTIPGVPPQNAAGSATTPGAAIVPSPWQELDQEGKGGQS